MALRRRLQSALTAACVLAAAAALLPPVLYLAGRVLAPPLPDQPTGEERLPPIVRDALWARFGGEGRMPREPVSATGVLRFEWCMARAGLTGGRTEVCSSRDRTLVLTGLVAADHLRRAGGAGDDVGPAEVLAHLSTTVWIGRHWSAGDVLTRYAASAPVAPDYADARRAAADLFGTDLDTLTPEQAALLAVLHHRDDDLEPRRDPATARLLRNRVLERMADNRSVPRRDLARLRSRPLGLEP